MRLKYTTWLLVVAGLILISSYHTERKQEVEYFDISRALNNIEWPQNKVVADYSSFLERELDSVGNVGAAVAIVSHDSLIFQQTFGLRKAGTTDSVNENTVFRLASVSKGFAGVLGAILDRDKVLSLDEKIIDIIPGFVLKDPVNTQELTIKHTLNHTSGLVPHAFDNLVEEDVPMSDIIYQFKDVDIAAAPGLVYGYQNAIFSLIDTVLRIKTNKTYNDFLSEKIFNPLGMDNASADFSHVMADSNIAFPHVYTGKAKGFVPIRLNTHYYSASPAAGVNASISDMAIWLKALLGANPEVMDTAVLNNIATPTVYTPLKRAYTARWDKVENREYSLGWRIFSYKGRKVVYHGGYVRGYRAEIAFCPEEETGIVFLQNSPNRLAAMSVPEFWNRYFAMVDRL